MVGGMASLGNGATGLGASAGGGGKGGRLNEGSGGRGIGFTFSRFGNGAENSGRQVVDFPFDGFGGGGSGGSPKTGRGGKARAGLFLSSISSGSGGRPKSSSSLHNFPSIFPSIEGRLGNGGRGRSASSSGDSCLFSNFSSCILPPLPLDGLPY